ncbi:cytosine permease [Actinobaculum suis]|uniref:Cytosine permease n=1 Tax=Actinobaculum suis TaxID=1657 RepID=A0A1G7DXS5_9ACTO|nr:cytosine permease [Actinobaculum suis]MDY5152904.1 cytosine permease [Actinobaculum suis]SDE55956.1 cytosine permease [Actinobaculum suis]
MTANMHVQSAASTPAAHSTPAVVVPSAGDGAGTTPIDPQVKLQPIDDDFSFGAVPISSRRSFWSVGFVMLGFTFFSASMSVGAKLGNGLDLGGFLAAVSIGGVILAIYTGALAYVGARTGMGVDELARHAFGRRGSYLPSFLIAFTQMGWFGVGVAMFAMPTADLLGISPWPIVLIAGALMTASAYYGIKAIEIVSFISVPLITILGTYSMVTATVEAGGVAEVFGESGGMPIMVGVGMVVGSFISGGSATPNFARFARTARSAVITTVIAFLLGNTLMFSFGAVGGAFTGKDDIFYVMIAQGLAIPALLVLGANIWTTNNNALYTTGLGFANITKRPKRPLVFIAGTAGTLGALWLYNNFVGWLNFLNATLPPIGAILVADYLVHRRAYHAVIDAVNVAEAAGQPLPIVESAGSQRNIAWAPVAGVIGGAAAGWLIPFGIASLNAVVAAVLIYGVGVLAETRAQSETSAQAAATPAK